MFDRNQNIAPIALHSVCLFFLPLSGKKNCAIALTPTKRTKHPRCFLGRWFLAIHMKVSIHVYPTTSGQIVCQ